MAKTRNGPTVILVGRTKQALYLATQVSADAWVIVAENLDGLKKQMAKQGVTNVTMLVVTDEIDDGTGESTLIKNKNLFAWIKRQSGFLGPVLFVGAYMNYMNAFKRNKACTHTAYWNDAANVTHKVLTK